MFVSLRKETGTSPSILTAIPFFLAAAFFEASAGRGAAIPASSFWGDPPHFASSNETTSELTGEDAYATKRALRWAVRTLSRRPRYDDCTEGTKTSEGAAGAPLSWVEAELPAQFTNHVPGFFLISFNCADSGFAE